MNISLENLQVFLLVVLPGFVAIKVYDLFCPPEKRSFGESLVDAVAYGLINFALWSWMLFDLDLKSSPQENPALFTLKCLLFLIVSPLALAYGLYRLRSWKWLAHKFNIDEPTKTAWDHFFCKGVRCYMLFHLKNGMKVGGFFGPNSYVATFPQKQEIYVEQVWRVDQEHCTLDDATKGTLGMVVRAYALNFTRVGVGSQDFFEKLRI